MRIISDRIVFRVRSKARNVRQSPLKCPILLSLDDTAAQSYLSSYVDRL